MGLLDDETKWPSHRAEDLDEMGPGTLAQDRDRETQILEAWKVTTVKLGWTGKANMVVDRRVEMKKLQA
jgi:hypothetical protein